MANIICDWISCKFNSSKTNGVCGECKKEDVLLTSFSIDSCDDEGADIEGLECRAYQR